VGLTPENDMASEEHQLYADSIDPVLRTFPDQLFLVTLEAEPEPDSEEFGELGGAFVNCWMDADDLRTAEQRAMELVQEDGWRPVRFESWEIVTRATYADDKPAEGSPDYQELIDQAFAEGAAIVFFTWPADAEEEDD
jgi:hypothetical protein